jgi:hypothetical protein
MSSPRFKFSQNIQIHQGPAGREPGCRRARALVLLCTVPFKVTENRLLLAKFVSSGSGHTESTHRLAFALGHSFNGTLTSVPCHPQKQYTEGLLDAIFSCCRWH